MVPDLAQENIVCNFCFHVCKSKLICCLDTFTDSLPFSQLFIELVLSSFTKFSHLNVLNLFKCRQNPVSFKMPCIASKV